MASTDEDDDDYAPYVYMQPPTTVKVEKRAPEEKDEEIFATFADMKELASRKNEETSPLPSRKILIGVLNEMRSKRRELSSDVQTVLQLLERLKMLINLSAQECSVLLSNWSEMAMLAKKIERVVENSVERHAIDETSSEQSILTCFKQILVELANLFNDRSTSEVLLTYASNRYAQLKKYKQVVDRVSRRISMIDQLETLESGFGKPESNLAAILTQVGDLANYVSEDLMKYIFEVRSAVSNLLSRMKEKALCAEHQEELQDLKNKIKFDPEKWPNPDVCAPNRRLQLPITRFLLSSKLPREGVTRQVSPHSYTVVLQYNYYITLLLFNDLLLVSYRESENSDLIVISCAKRSDVKMLDIEGCRCYSASTLPLRFNDGYDAIEISLHADNIGEACRWKEVLLDYDPADAENGQLPADQYWQPTFVGSTGVEAGNDSQPPPTPSRLTRPALTFSDSPNASNRSSSEKKFEPLDDTDVLEKQALEKVLVECMNEIADLRVRTPDKPCRRLLQETSKVKEANLWSRLDHAEQTVQELMFELFVTEMTFFHNLHLIVWRLFNKPDFRYTLSAHDMRSLVSYVPTIYEISGEMVHAMALHWQNSCDCLLLNADFLRVFKEKVESERFQKIYPLMIIDQAIQSTTLDHLLSRTNNRRSSISIVQDCGHPITSPVLFHQAVKRFQQFFSPPARLRDLLLSPFQRLTSLRLLMQRIVEETRCDSEERKLAQEIEYQLQKLLTTSNERKRNIDNRARLLKLCEEFDSRQPFKQIDLMLFQNAHDGIKQQDVFTWAKLDDGSKNKRFEKVFKKGPLINVELIHLDDSLMLGVRKKNGKLTVIDYDSLTDVKFEKLGCFYEYRLESLRKQVETSPRFASIPRRPSAPSALPVEGNEYYFSTTSQLMFKLETKQSEFILRAESQSKYQEWLHFFTAN